MLHEPGRVVAAVEATGLTDVEWYLRGPHTGATRPRSGCTSWRGGPESGQPVVKPSSGVHVVFPTVIRSSSICGSRPTSGTKVDSQSSRFGSHRQGVGVPLELVADLPRVAGHEHGVPLLTDLVAVHPGAPVAGRSPVEHGGFAPGLVPEPVRLHLDPVPVGGAERHVVPVHEAVRRAVAATPVDVDDLQAARVVVGRGPGVAVADEPEVGRPVVLGVRRDPVGAVGPQVGPAVGRGSPAQPLGGAGRRGQVGGAGRSGQQLERAGPARGA